MFMDFASEKNNIEDVEIQLAETIVAEVTAAETKAGRRSRRLYAWEVTYLIGWGLLLVQMLALVFSPRVGATEDVLYVPVFIIAFASELTVAALGAFLLAAVLYGLRRGSFLSGLGLWVGTGILGLVLFVLVFVFASQPHLTHVGRAEIDGQVYYLAETSGPLVPYLYSHERLIFACDRLGSSCDLVERMTLDPGYYFHDDPFMLPE